MKEDEIDQIIEQSLADSKKQSKWRRPKQRSQGKERARAILNTLFMLGFLAAIIVYFAMPDHRTLFFCIGFGSMLLKIVEFIIRFML